jgi:hypothetical protein
MGHESPGEGSSHAANVGIIADPPEVVGRRSGHRVCSGGCFGTRCAPGPLIADEVNLAGRIGWLVLGSPMVRRRGILRNRDLPEVASPRVGPDYADIRSVGTALTSEDHSRVGITQISG